METLTSILNTLSSFIWGPVTLVLLLGVGIYLSLGLRPVSYTHLTLPTICSV